MPDLPAKRDPLPPQRPQLTSNRRLTELTVEEMSRVSVAFQKSQTFKNKGTAMTASELFVVILAGQELGLGPSQSVMGIKMIEGKPELSANTMAALVKASGKYDYRVTFDDSDPANPWCEVSFFLISDGSSVGVSRFSRQDAETAGLWRNNYLKYPRSMLFARALSNGVKWYTPDALMVSAYHEGEIGGDTEAPPPPQHADTQPKLSPPVPELDDTRQHRLAIEDAEKVPVTVGAEPYDRPEESEEQVDEADVTVMDVLTEDLNDPGAREPGDEDNPLPFEPATEPPPPIVTPPPVVTSEEQTRTATPAQIKLLRVKQKAAGLTDERWHEILHEIAGVRHTDRTPFDAVNPLLARLDEEAKLND